MQGQPENHPERESNVKLKVKLRVTSPTAHSGMNRASKAAAAAAADEGNRHACR